MAKARGHAAACEAIALIIAVLTLLFVLGSCAAALAAPDDFVLLVLAAPVAALVGSSWWALMRAVGIALRLRVDELPPAG